MLNESHPYYKHPTRVDFMVAKNYLEYMMESYSWNDKMYFNEGLIKTYNPEFCIKRLQHEFHRNFGIKLIELHGNCNVDSNKSYIFINYPDNPLSDKYCNGTYSKIELGIYKIGMFIYVDESQDSNLKNEEYEDSINFICQFTGMYISNSKIIPCEDGGHIFKFVIEPKFSDKKFELNKCDDIKFLYHLTKTSKVKKILDNGLNPKSSNPMFDYPDRIYLGIDSNELEKNLLEQFKKIDDVKYTTLKIDISRIPSNVKFNIDPNYPNGIFTSGNIPPNAISIHKEN